MAYAAGMRVTSLDHVVLKTADPERTIAWYRDKLGLEPVRLDEWRRGEVPFASLRIDDSTLIDVIEGERTGENVDHLSFAVDTDLDEIAASGEFEVVMEPKRLFGAQGHGPGMYVRDPDGNRIELKYYPAG